MVVGQCLRIYYSSKQINTTVGHASVLYSVRNMHDLELELPRLCNFGRLLQLHMGRPNRRKT